MKDSTCISGHHQSNLVKAKLAFDKVFTLLAAFALHDPAVQPHVHKSFYGITYLSKIHLFAHALLSSAAFRPL